MQKTWAICLMAWVGATASERGLEEFLDESIWGYVSVKSTSELSEKLAGEGQLLDQLDPENAEKLKKYFTESEMLGHFQDMSYQGEPMSWEMFKEHFPERVLVAAHGMAIDEETGAEDVQFVLMADFEGEIDFLIETTTTMYAANDDVEMTLVEEDYLGVTLYFEEIEDEFESSIYSAWTLVDGVFIEAMPVSLLKETVERVLSEETKHSLAENSDYQEAQARLDGTEVSIYVNAVSIVDYIKADVLSAENELPPNPLGVTMEKLVDALRLDVFKSLYVGVSELDKGLQFDSGLLFSEQAGLLSILAYGSDVDMDVNFIPDEALSASISHFSFSKAVEAIEDALTQMSPNFESFYQLQLDNLKNKLGFDIKENLINNIGDEIIVYNEYSEDASGETALDITKMNRVIAVEIKDPKSLEITLEGLKDMASQGNEMFVTRDFLGTQIYLPNPKINPNNAFNYSYAIKDNYFLFAIGDSKSLERTLQNMESKESYFWDKAHVRDTLSQLPPKPSEINYSDLGKLWSGLLSYFQDISNTVGGVGNQGVDFNAIPDDLELDFFVITANYLESDGFLSRALILPKPEEDE